MKRGVSLVKNKGLINTSRRFKIRLYLNKTLQKKRFRFFFTKYLSFLFFLNKGFCLNHTLLRNLFLVVVGRINNYAFLHLSTSTVPSRGVFFKSSLIMFI